MKQLNFLSKSSSQSGSHRVVTLASTVGSPSAHRRGTMLKHVAFLLLFLIAGIGNVWGASASFSASGDYSSFSNHSLTKDGVTISGFGAESADDLRVYKGSTLTIECATNITAISITFTGTANNGGWGSSNSYSESNLSTTKWTKTATSGKSGKQARITDLIVTYLGKVTFNANGGSCGTTNLTQATATSSITLPTPTRIGFTCTGWYTASSGGTKRGNAGGTYTPSVSETLYAQWEAEAPAYTITAVSNNNSYGTVALAGSVITATPAHCYEYASTAYTVSPSGKATVTQGTGENINKFTVSNVQANVTVTINFTAKASGRTVNFDAGPGVCATTSLTEDCLGDGVTLPNVTASGVCKGWTTFAGWAITAISDSTTTSGVTLLAAGSKFTPSSDGQTLYAVYSKSKGGAAPTAYSAGDTGDFVLAAYNTSDSKWYALPTTPSLSSGKIAGSVITVSTTSNSVNYVTSANASGYTWTIANATNGQTITDGTKNNNNPNYIYHSNGGSSGTNLDYGTSTSYTWKIESETNGLTFKAMSGSTTNSRGMLVSGTQFGGYSLSNEDNSGYYRIQVLPIADASTTYYCSDPNCCTELGSIYGSVSWNNGEATVSWDDVTGMSNWKLYRSEHNADSWTEVTGLSSSAGRYSNSTAISGLTAGQEYDFKVTGTYSGSTYCAKDYTFTFSSMAPKITTGAVSGASSYKVGNGPGTKQTFTVSAVGLNDNLTINAPTNFLVCKTENGTYTSSVTLNHSEGTVASTTIYVQLAADLAVNDYNANVGISGGGAVSVNVAVSGVVSPDCSDPTINTQPSGATYNMGATATALSVVASKDGSSPTLTYQWYSNTANNNTTGTPIAGETNSTYTPSTADAGTKYYYCVVYSGACSVTSNVAAVTVNTPIISVGDEKTIVAFGDKAFESTNTETITISGSNLANAENIGLAIEGTGASAYALSVNGNPVSELEASNGSVAETTVTITYTAAAGLSEATLTISSEGAESKEIALSGTGKYQVTYRALNNSQTTFADNEGKLVLPTNNNPSSGNDTYNTFIGWYSTAAKDNGDPTTDITECGTKAVTTHVLEGNETYYAVWGNGPATGAWTEAAIGNISSSDAVVIAMKNSSDEYYALPSNGGDAKPTAKAITVSNGEINTDATPITDNDKWNISNSSGTLTLYPAGTTSTWLYCNNTNDGVRINGTSADKAFTIETYSEGHDFLYNTTHSRYVGVYNSADWRCYALSGTPLSLTNNISGQTVKFFKEGSGAATGFISSSCETWNAPTVSYDVPNNWKVGDADVTVSITGQTYGTASYESSNSDIISVDGNGKITAVAVGTATITVIWSGSSHCDKAVTTSAITVHGFVDVTFKKNGGSGTDDQKQSVEVGVSTALTSLATLGYGAPDCKEFGGWATTSDGEAVYDDGASISANEATTLWAVWNTKTLSVAKGTGTAVGCEGDAFTFASSVACGGNVTITSSPDATHKAPFTITVLPANAYEEIDGNVIKNVTKPITSISVSYAEKTTYAITWNVNDAPYAPHQEEEDGKVNGDALVYEGNTIATLPTAPANNTLGCANTFMGWSTHDYKSVKKAASDYDDLFSDVADAPEEISKATTFYAVFATASGESSWTELINEEFDNTQTTDATTAIESSTFANFSGATDKAYKGSGGIKFGSSKGTGYITTKELDLSKDFKVSLKAKIYGTDSPTLYVTVGEETQSVSTSSTDPLTDEYKTFVFEFDATEETEIEIGTSANRAYIDDVVISKKALTFADYVTECAAVEAPTFSVAAGTYNEAQSVTLSSATDGADIYYTTNGSTPTSGSTAYSGAIAVNQNMTIKAIAIKGSDESDVAEAAYVLKVATPEISGATSFVTPATVTITATGADAIYYTDDDSDPASSGTKKTYSAPFEVSETTTIKAIAVKANWTSSDVASETFTKITPMTVATALTNINALDNNGTIEDQYVKGLISQIVSYNSGNTITYYISDDGTTSSQLQVFKGSAGVANGGNAFTSVDDLKVGEEVVVFGTLKKYKSGSNPVIPEFVNPNEIVAYRPYSPIAWSANAYTAELGGSSNVFPSLSGTAGLTISYSSSDPTKASFADASVYDITLNAVTGEDPITITASSAATDDYVATSKSYALTVAAAVTRYSISYEKNGGTSDATDSDGETETNLPNPLPTITKAGYNFGGWYTTSDFQQATKVSGGEALTENTTLYAQWLEPYTVAQALTKIAALDDNGITEAVYVRGEVTDVALTLESGNTATYIIKDAGESNSLKVYKGKGKKTELAPSGENITEASYLQEGDAVVLYGQLMKYVKNSTTTPEVTSSFIYSFNRPTYDVTGVMLPSTANVRAGKTITLTATITPSNATNKNVTWSVTEGSAYAEVSNTGVVTGKAEGTATIQVETEDGGFTATCTVTVAGALPNFATDDTHEWIKVTSDTKLQAGRFYVIACDSKGKTMTKSVSGGRMDDVTSTFNDGRIVYNALGANTAILELGGTSGAWTLLEVSTDKYLGGTTSSSLSWEDDEATTAIAISEGDATIGSSTSGQYRILYNNGSTWFAPYSSATNAGMLLPQLYMWAELSHSVTFDANGGVVESVPGVERTDEGKIIIPATTPTHSDISKAFGGWYKSDAPATLYNAGDEFETNVNVTLYAKWNPVPTYTVTYVPGGTGTVPAVASYREGQKVQVEEVSLSNPGYSFAGWTVKDAEQNVLPLDEENKFDMPASNVTITAVWSRISSQKWNLVKYGEALEIDAEYVIAYNSTNTKKALSSINTSGNTHYGNSVEVTIDGEVLKGSELMKALTLKDGNGGSNYAFKNGDNYLTWSSGNSLDESATLNNASSWTIDIDENDVATITNVGTTARMLQFNSSNSRYACYQASSKQQNARLYKKAASVVINNEQTVNAEDIPANADVTVHNGGTLNVNAAKSVGDLTVENGGKVVLAENKLTVVGTFIIESTMASGASGQMAGATVSNFVATGEAYIDITLGKNGDPNQWHAFTVPFPVDAINGVFDLNNEPLKNEVNYAIMEYLGDVRAQGKYGWKKIRTTLVPGTFYLMTVDGLRTTYRFKKTTDGALVAGNTKDLEEYPLNGGTEEHNDNGWNGVGNPTLRYGQVAYKVQILNPTSYTYEPFEANETNFVVGTPFFIQADAVAAAADMTFGTASGEVNYAPARTPAKGIESVKVTFGNEEYKDRLYISASEDALNEYETGKDLAKMTMTSTPKVAQIFGKAYNSKLCMVYAPMSNDQAVYDLTLYAPQAGEYTIAAPEVENADLYLTKDGAIIWNLTMSEYPMELKKGNTDGYGLLLQKKAPQTPTGVDEVDAKTGVQKIIIDDNVFILRGGQMYDVTGKAVK